jgi:hypothetical protein
MKKSSAGGKLVRYTAEEIPDATPADLQRLRTVASGPIDTSEIPEWRGGGRPVLRNAQGRLVERKIGLIAQAILSQLDHRQMTRYRLWQEAKAHCPTLSESAVYSFLGGTRQIEVPYVEALMKAVGLEPLRRGETTSRIAAKKAPATQARKIIPVAPGKPVPPGKPKAASPGKPAAPRKPGKKSLA